MKYTVKKTWSLVLVLSLIITLFQSFISTPIVNADSEDAKIIIQKMVTSVQERDWDTFIKLMSNEEQSYYIKYFSEDSYTKGVKQVDTMELESIMSVENNLARQDLLTNEYPILNTSKNVQTFIVGLECKVKMENQYFYNGLNYFIIALAEENGELKIVQFNRPSHSLSEEVLEPTIDETDTKYKEEMGALKVIENADQGYLVNSDGQAITEGFKVIAVATNNYVDHPALKKYTYYSAPDTILVKMSKIDGDVVEYPFDYYIRNTICNEWYSSWNSASLYAGAYCIKGVGWYRIIRPVSSIGAYDVTQGTQNFVPGTTTTTTDAIFDAIDGKFIVNSDNKVFFPEYGAGDSGVAGTAGSGRLLQWGSQYLANNGYTYKSILNYYYSDSDCSTGDLKYVTVK